MLFTSKKWNKIQYLRFTNSLSITTLKLLKEQVYRFLRDKEKDYLFEQFMSWQSKDNEIMLYTDYSQIELDLPASFDSIAEVDSIKNSDNIQVQVIIPYSILNGWAAINKIALGHRHVCLLQFNSEIPEILKKLPDVNSTNESNKSDVLLYNLADITSTSS